MFSILITALAAGAPVAAHAPPPAVTEMVAARDDQPDLVVLVDGKEIECRVLHEGDEVVLARVGARKREIPVAEIAQIQTIERSLAEFFERYEKLADRGTGGLATLARYCEQSELPGESRVLWLRILLMDPNSELAWSKLGGTFSKRRGWRVRVRGRFYTLPELRERVADWKNAMELPSAHFLTRTDIAPEQALDVVLNLERAYLSFYDTIGEALDLQVFDEVPAVHIYSDPDDYPTPRFAGDNAWFSRGENTVHVNGTGSRIRQETVFHLTHALVYNSFRRTIGGSGSIAPWSERAIAEAFADAVRVENGIASWEFGAPIQPLFSLHARDDEPLTLKQVVASGYGAYNSGSDANRYIAQSHTLFHFLMEAEDGKYRDGFADYLRSSFKGKSAATHLEEALGVDLDVVEGEWHAYARAVAAR